MRYTAFVLACCGIGMLLSTEYGSSAQAANKRTTSNVTAVLQGDTDNELSITGDSGNNSIVIFDVLRLRVVAGLAGTRVNNQLLAVFNRTNIDTTVIATHGGDDSVRVVSDISADESFEADGGLGDDTLEVEGDISLDADLEIDGFETLIPPDLGL